MPDNNISGNEHDNDNGGTMTPQQQASMYEAAKLVGEAAMEFNHARRMAMVHISVENEQALKAAQCKYDCALSAGTALYERIQGEDEA